MTREEAVKWLEETIQDTDTYWESCSDALQKELDEQKEVFLVALTALRPVSREQVEKVWRDEWQKDIPMGYKCNSCEGLIVGQTPFCPVCGKAMTDEAVEMVMERMETIR